MQRRKVRDAEEARQLLIDVELHGMTRRELCRDRGVDARSLNAWRVNLERKSGPGRASPPVRLVELVVEKPPVAASSSFRVWHGDFAVEFDGAAEAEVIRKVLWAVSQC